MHEKVQENLSDEIEPGVTWGDAFLRQFDKDQRDIAREDAVVLVAMRKNGHRVKSNDERVIFHRYIR